jgi:cytochrome c553|tara:strand:- start:3959 stop:4579 length:621 start_codon:yes stop_codon:yes gene_type:complete
MRFARNFLFILFILTTNIILAETFTSKDLKATKKIISNLCIACHAADGNSTISTNPKLAGQHAAYITKQLINFKSGTRDNAVMAGMVANLTDEDMKNLGLFYASQSLTLGAAKENGIGSLGEKIFRSGLNKKGVPACAGCHGPSGHGIPDTYPRLNAQHADYTVSQLNLFRLGKRANDPAMMMRSIAQKLTEDEMQAVADYIQGLR